MPAITPITQQSVAGPQNGLGSGGPAGDELRGRRNAGIVVAGRRIAPIGDRDFDEVKQLPRLDLDVDLDGPSFPGRRDAHPGDIDALAADQDLDAA